MKKFIQLTIIFSSVILISSCDTWLDVQPEDGVVRERYWKTKEEVRAAVLGCYSQMLDSKMMQEYFVWGEMRAEMATPASAARPDLVALNTGEITSTNTYTDWASFYKVINQCNTVIELAPAVLDIDESFSERLLNEYIAEVTSIRSLMYFYLVRTFRDVPYSVTASIYDYQDFSLPKTDGKIIIDNLITSLEAIESNIPTKYDNTTASQQEGANPNKGRINYYGWASLLADIYLWKGEFDKCIDMTTRVIESGQYSLVPVARTEVLSYNIETGRTDTVYEAQQGDVVAMFNTTYAQGNSVESIFELQNPSTYINPFVSMFSANVANQIEVNQASFSNEYFIPSNIDRIWRDIRTEGIAFQGKFVWKWAGLNNTSSPVQWRTTSTSNSNWIFYRLADVMLMKAEALTQKAMANNNQEQLLQALELVQKIRARGNAPESTDLFYKHVGELDAKTMEEFVLAERTRELTFEGKRWFDLIRMAQRDNFSERTMGYLLRMVVLASPPEKTSIIQSKWQTNQGSLYLPINSGELQRNKNLVQNDFYLK
ncbi:MAG: RagB/SusD family nutrient uptake outer membrane protein [Paludibacteraceae bacterium]|nr:RagB/SusD family nutrient uptake outer membrane protein [Paludibacteraceae bacterium]